MQNHFLLTTHFKTEKPTSFWTETEGYMEDLTSLDEVRQKMNKQIEEHPNGVSGFTVIEPMGKTTWCESNGSPVL